MTIHQKRTGRAASMPAGLAFGACVNLAVTLAGSVLLAKLLDQGKLQWSNIGYAVMVLLLAASYLGAFCAQTKIKSKRLLVCALSGLIYICVLISITALFFGGQYEALGVTAALVLAGSGTAGLLGLREKRDGKRLKRSRYSR